MICSSLKKGNLDYQNMGKPKIIQVSKKTINLFNHVKFPNITAPRSETLNEGLFITEMEDRLETVEFASAKLLTQTL
jgi:hypothetical protein